MSPAGTSRGNGAAGGQCRPQRVRCRTPAPAGTPPRRCPARQVHGDDAHAAAGLRAAQADAGSGACRPETLTQRQLMAAQALNALLLHKGQRRAGRRYPADSRAGFQPVRQIRRQQLTVRGAAVPPATSGVRLAASSSVSSSAPMPLGRGRPFVPGTASAERQRRKVDGSVRPSARHPAGKSIRAARRPPPDGGRIRHTAADVGCMRQHNKARVGPEQALERAMLQKALAVAGNAVKFHAPELPQRPHDSVVLHR